MGDVRESLGSIVKMMRSMADIVDSFGEMADAIDQEAAVWRDDAVRKDRDRLKAECERLEHERAAAVGLLQGHADVIRALEDRVRDLVTVMREIEWSGFVGWREKPGCPVCDRPEEEGHGEGCIIDRALRNMPVVDKLDGSDLSGPVVLDIGLGRVSASVGDHAGRPAVFLWRLKEHHPPGSDVPEHHKVGHPVVLTFPTHTRSREVFKALTGTWRKDLANGDFPVEDIYEEIEAVRSGMTDVIPDGMMLLMASVAGCPIDPTQVKRSYYVRAAARIVNTLDQWDAAEAREAADDVSDRMGEDN